MTMKPAGDDVAAYQNGRTIITSTESESTLIVTPGQRQFESTGEISFLARVENNGTQPFTIDATNITATNAEKQLKVWTYDQRMKKARNAAMWAGIAAGMAAASDGMNQQRTNTYTNGSARAYGSTASYSGTSTSTTTGLSQDEINRRNRERSDQIANGFSSMSAQAETILSTTTLQPGDYVTGSLIMSRPKAAGPIELIIQAGKDRHTVTFNYQPVE